MQTIKAFIAILILTSCATVSAQPELPTVPMVDLNQYIGKWYEIAAIPQSFQKKCIKNTTAEYSFGEDGLVMVKNSCATADGSISVAQGAARIEDTVTQAKLKVTFVKLFDWIFTFGGDYWIIDLAPDYSYAVVGHPDRTYGWILARTSSLDLQTLKDIRSRLEKNNYDTCKILTSVQDNGIADRKPLCELE